MKPAFLLILLGLGLATPCMAAGQAQGETQLTLPNGSVYIGTVKDGVPDGRGYFRDPDGMQYEGEVHEGRREGVGEGLFPNGDDYKGEWKNGKPDGKGSKTYFVGGAYEGEWKDGSRHGKGVLTFANSGRRQEVRFVDGERVDAATSGTERTFTLKEYDGRSIRQHRRVVSESTFPPDISYDRFTPEQKRAFNMQYPALEDGDEPPYPLQGQLEIIKVIRALQKTFEVEGDVDVYVTVDSKGEAESVKTIGLDNKDARRALAAAAGVIKYKPARCAGQPCRGIARVRYSLTWDN